MSELLPCRGCRRHLRSETVCPFCGTSEPLSEEGVRPKLGRIGRMIVVAGTTSVVGVTACGAYGGPPPRPANEAPAPTASAEPSTSASVTPDGK